MKTTEEIIEAPFLVWWLTENDYHGFEPCQEQNPLGIPDYVWKQFVDRHGRAGRGRLWVPPHIPIKSMPVEQSDPRWPKYLSAGGIVIETKDAIACARWGGCFTTLTLDPVVLSSTSTLA